MKIKQWPYIPDHPYRILLIIRGSGSGKTIFYQYLADDMVADMINNKKINSIVTESFIRGSKYVYCFYYTSLF